MVNALSEKSSTGHWGMTFIKTCLVCTSRYRYVRRAFIIGRSVAVEEPATDDEAVDQLLVAIIETSGIKRLAG